VQYKRGREGGGLKKQAAGSLGKEGQKLDVNLVRRNA